MDTLFIDNKELMRGRPERINEGQPVQAQLACLQRQIDKLKSELFGMSSKGDAA